MGDVTVEQSEQRGVGRSVLWPACLALAVGVVVVDEVDEIVGQVPSAEEDAKVTGVELAEGRIMVSFNILWKKI